MVNVNLGISTSLYADNSTSFLLQNSAFDNVSTIIQDSRSNAVLLPGHPSTKVMVDSWGFGQVTSAAGQTGFVNGQNIAAMTRAAPLIQEGDVTADQPFFFTRRRPDYSTLGNSQLMDVKAYGAKGDGSSDDTAVLNHILDVAANVSAIVYFPFGVYMISDTLNVPVGSRIIGQAWAQIMATGSAFSNIANPHVAVKVGTIGSVGPVEIQCMMFTVRGATAGAVLVEWNVHESTQGSAGLWGKFQYKRLGIRLTAYRFTFPCRRCHWLRPTARTMSHNFSKYELYGGVPSVAYHTASLSILGECVDVVRYKSLSRY